MLERIRPKQDTFLQSRPQKMSSTVLETSKMFIDCLDQINVLDHVQMLKKALKLCMCMYVYIHVYMYACMY